MSPGARAISILRIGVRHGAEEEFAHAFDRLGVFDEARRASGLIGGRLLRPQAEGGPFLVIAEWRSAADYEGWLASPIRERLAGKLEPLVDGEPAAGELYTVVGELRS